MLAGIAFWGIPPESLYPTIGVGFGSGPVRVRVNFGPRGFCDELSGAGWNRRSITPRAEFV